MATSPGSGISNSWSTRPRRALPANCRLSLSSSFSRGCLSYELAYGKGLTPFLRVARSAGAGRLADGVGMLVEQAAEAFEWWLGIRPDTEPVIERLTVRLI